MEWDGVDRRSEVKPYGLAGRSLEENLSVRDLPMRKTDTRAVQAEMRLNARGALLRAANLTGLGEDFACATSEALEAAKEMDGMSPKERKNYTWVINNVRGD